MTHVPQVGGDHYQVDSNGDNDNDIQHWDVMEAFDVSYLEATASKYITRARKKGTEVLDLGKSISYLEKLLSEREEVRRRVPRRYLRQFIVANKLDGQSAAWVMSLLIHGRRLDITWVIADMRDRLEHIA